jgi:Fe-S oxidoreductase
MCCGGPLMSADPEMAKQIAQSRIKEAMQLGADVVVTSCPACMINLRSGAQEMETNVTVQDLPLLLPSLLERKRREPKQ